jgi:hypothetical protein
MSTLEFRIVAWLTVLALLASALLWAHHKGAADVQAQWDAAKAVQAAQVAVAEQQKQAAEDTQRETFNTLAAKYEAATHAQPPIVADPTAVAVNTGALRLRGETNAPGVCARPADLSGATARSRALDAAATQALADRTANSIAAVRAGDDADRRERQLDQQITILQALLRSERQ